MAYINLTAPGTASDPNNGWTNENNILSSTDSNAVGTYPAGSGTDPVIISNFGPDLPARASIVGFDVTYSATRNSGAVVSDETLNFQLTIDGSNGVGTAKTGAALPASPTFLTETLGGSTDMWGSSITSSQVDGNSSFGVIVTRSGGTAKNRQVDYLQMKVYYTISSYQDGSLSTFPTSLDDIPIMYNGTGPEHQVRSEDVNLLGDCLFNIETSVLASTGIVRSAGAPIGQTMYLFSITVTGTVPTSGGVVTFERQVLEKFGNTEIDRTTTNLSSILRTKQPYATAACHFVSAIGWVNNAGNQIPVYISPRASLFRNDSDYGAFICGFTAVGSGIATNTAYTNENYSGVYSTMSGVTSGQLIVKMLAIGK